MPWIVECEGVKEQQLKECMKFYSPIYQRNLPAIGKCLDGEGGDLECMKLYGATCPSDPKPPKGAQPRDADPKLYKKYIEPTCPKLVSGPLKLLATLADFIKSWA
jgi:hypothetical protein